MSNEKREPGCYWVKRDAASEWEIVQVHPVDDWGRQSIDSMGWDAGACLPPDAEWGPRILPPDALPDADELEDMRRERDEALDAARQLGDKADNRVRDAPRGGGAVLALHDGDGIMSTYCINTMVGLHARWLPSEDAAKERWRENHARRVKEHEEDGDEPPGVLEFLESFTDDQGDPCDRHLAIREGDSLVGTIWLERPAWPSPGSPSLVMISQPSDGTCRHRLLACKFADAQEPLIVCTDCGAEWKP